jgi:GPH family glycoside/pentoside/hexuronide:cation symporter
MPWLYALALNPIFGGEMSGVRWVSVGVAVLILLAGCLPAFLCREPQDNHQQETVNFKDAVKWTLKNRAFVILLGTNLIVLCGLAATVSLSLYLNIYYVFGGDKGAAGKLVGLSGTLSAISSYASVYMATLISTRFGKRLAMEVGLVLAALGTASLWWTLSPERPYLQLISSILIGLGLQGCWMLFVSMTGDVCDEDELQTGLRREGMYSAIGGFSRKMAVAIAALGTGLLLNLAGFDAATAEATGASADVLWRLKAFFCLGQTLVLVAGMLLLRLYPITRDRALATRRAIEDRAQRQALAEV